MIITKVDNSTFQHNADQKREKVKEAINECINYGVGVYEIKDYQHIFTSNARMLEYLKHYAWRNNRGKEITYDINVVSKYKCSKIYVVVKEKEIKSNESIC